MKRLNMGCGNIRKEGWINCDFVKTKATDYVFDMTKFPYPFGNNTVDEIEMIEVLEHLPDTVTVIRECHRMLKQSGKLHITVPYYLAVGAWSNPEHKRAFNYQTFKYFIERTDEQKMHNFGFAFSEGTIRVTCGRGKNFMNHITEVLFNSMPEVCDRTFLKFMFTPDGITATLIK